LRGALALCGLLALWQAGPLQGGANLEEKARYERSLEQKAEEVLANLLGPGKGKVAVQAAIDFSSKESVSSEGAKAGGEDLAFPWQDINKAAEGGGQELLPGFPVASKLNPGQQGAGGKMQREVSFPVAMVKRLTVALVLSEVISDVEAQKVRQVISDLLAMDQARGDEIIVTKARFAPIWYTAETLNLLMKYGIIALIAIAGMIIVGMGFLKMAGAVNNMAGASQPQKLSMELGGGLGMEHEGADAAALEHKPCDAESAAGQLGETAPDGIIFNVKEDKLGLLVLMLTKDEPADISLIAVHLPPGMRSRFIGLLPHEKAAEVVASMAKVRFVDPEMILKIKEELERRLSGAVGGYEKVLEVIDNVDLKSKKRLLENLEKSHPEVAGQVRHRVLLPDDLWLLDDKDFAILAGTATVDKWSAVAWRMPESAKERLKSQMAERAWQMLEQTMKYGAPNEVKIDAAVDELVAAAWKLINEGRIKKPVIPTALAHEEAAKAPENKEPEEGKEAL
jgi:hypothetical protein